MSIEIYDKAKIIRKDGIYYYMLKHGSRNSFTCGGQSILDDNFRNKFIQRDSRDSTWHIIAKGNVQDYLNGRIADTYWNATTAMVYGRICFGNKKNIALYFIKTKPLDFYRDLDSSQQINVGKLITYSEDEKRGKPYTIDLSAIDSRRALKSEYEYCGETMQLLPHSLNYNGKNYWNVDNL